MEPPTPPSSSQGANRNHHVVVDVEPQQVAGAGHQLCAICACPTRWLAVGQCGHRAPCPGCMVQARFFQRDNRCCVCKARCPKVVVTRASGGAAALPALPWFCFRDGRAGGYWYHRHTAAYFEDEKEYLTARNACRGILLPFYRPLHILIPFMLFFVAVGVIISECVMREMETKYKSWAMKINQESLKMAVYVVSTAFAMLLCAFCWYLIRRPVGPVDEELFVAEDCY